MNNKILPPKIHVYYVAHRRTYSHVTQPLHRLKPRRLLVPSLFLLTLCIGLGSGAWLGLSSRFSQADREVNDSQNPAVLSAQSTIPLQFDQSELNVVANMLPTLIEENHHDPSPEEIKAAQRKTDLKKYLASRKSPLAEDDRALDTLLRTRNMKMILAISFVESNMCRKQVYNNCSGIGGSNIRKYKSFSQWIADFDNLLERRYKGLAVEQFIGYYVQPGSQNWVDGVYQVLDDLKDRHIE